MPSTSRRRFIGSSGAVLAAGVLPGVPARRSTDAPSPTVEWTRTFGGGGNDEPREVVATDGGGFLVGGTYVESDDSDVDAWLFEVDASGERRWENRYHATDTDGLRAAVAVDDGYAFAGSVGPGDPSGRRKALLVRVDGEGHERWRRTYAGSGDHAAYGLARAADGGFVLAGPTQSPDPRGTPSGDLAAWLMRVDGDGDERWRRTFDGPRYDWPNDVVALPDGGFALSGYTRSSGNGGEDGWLVVTDGEGRERFRSTYGGTGREEFSSVVPVEAGYAMAGVTLSTGDSDPLLALADPSGTAVWRRAFQGQNGLAQDLIALEDGYAVVGGGDLPWLVRTDRWGRERWAVVGFGLFGRDANAVARADDGYLVAGPTRYTRDAGSQAWLAKVRPPGA